MGQAHAAGEAHAVFRPARTQLKALDVPPTQMFDSNSGIDFYDNMHRMRRLILKANGFNEDIPYYEIPVNRKVKELIGNCRPVHRCDLRTFKLILQTGTLESRHIRQAIQDDPYDVLEKQVQADMRIYYMMSAYTKKLDVMPLVKWVVYFAKEELARLRGEPAQAFVEAAKQSEAEAMVFYGWNGLSFKTKEVMLGLWNELPEPIKDALDSIAAALRDLLGLPNYPGALTAYMMLLLPSAEQLTPAMAQALVAAGWDDGQGMSQSLKDALSCLDEFCAQEAAAVRTLSMLLKKLRGRAQVHAQNVYGAFAPGIGCWKDRELGTDKHVFSIVGPHFGHHYGNILIVLEQTVLHHPDFNMTPCAATGFTSGNAKRFNTWLERCDVKEFHRCKLNAGVQGWRSVMASALAHACAQDRQIKFTEVTVKEMLAFMCTINSHCLIEGHLPPLLPLKGYAEKIVMQKSTYERLADSEKSQVLELLQGNQARLHVVDRHLGPRDVLAACLFDSPEADSKGFTLTMLPSHVSCRLPVHSKKTGKMSLRFNVTAQHVQVLLGDSVGCIFILGLGTVSVSANERESPKDFLTKLGFPSGFLNELSKDELARLMEKRLEQLGAVRPHASNVVCSRNRYGSLLKQTSCFPQLAAESAIRHAFGTSLQSVLQSYSPGFEEKWPTLKSAWLSGTCKATVDCAEALPFQEAQGAFLLDVDSSACSIGVLQLTTGLRHEITFNRDDPAAEALSRICAVGFRSLLAEAELKDIKLM